MEGFAGPEKLLIHPNELLRDFPDLRALRYEDLDDGEADSAPGETSHGRTTTSRCCPASRGRLWRTTTRESARAR